MSLSRIEWKDEYNLGNQEIDGQHQQLFKLANAVLSEADREGVQWLIMELFHHTRLHFHDEEVFMHSRNYPGLREQQEQHNELIEKLGEVAAGCAKHPEQAQASLRSLMLEWVLLHILESDRKIVLHPEEIQS